MPLHPLAARFSGLADVYERGRPGYPPAAVVVLGTELGLAPGARVLDLAAGTGKLTRALSEAGFAVDAIEPQERLRALLSGLLPAERVHDGVAEAIPFPDGTFDAVTVADAFHWFDQVPAIAEIGRVLRPGGGLALVTALPELPHEIGLRLAAARTEEHPFFDGTPWQETLAATPGWSAPRQRQVTSRQTLPLADYVRSMSWVAAMAEAPRRELLAAIPAEPAEIAVHAVMTFAERA